MKKIVSLMIAGVVMLGVSGVVSGAVLLDEQFSGDLSNWTVLNSGGSTAAAASGGQLHITQTNSPQWTYGGVESQVAYAMPTGGMLVVDFYGTNIVDLPNALNTHSAPGYLVSQYQSTGNTFQGWNNYISIKRKDGTYGNWVQWTGTNDSGYVDIGSLNDGTYGTISKHMILTIDATNIKAYIADDYFENLVNPVAVYTTATSSIFNSEWTGAVYVNMMSEKITGWYSGTTVEDFDGVKVTAIPEPVSLVLLGVGSITMLLRKKK